MSACQQRVIERGTEGDNLRHLCGSGRIESQQVIAGDLHRIIGLSLRCLERFMFSDGSQEAKRDSAMEGESDVIAAAMLRMTNP
jgi:hypothetical protein